MYRILEVMITILLHTSKTMREVTAPRENLQQPILNTQANELAAYLQTLSIAEIEKSMQLSSSMAEKTHSLIAKFSPNTKNLLPAIDIFLGDIYSGLQAQTFSSEDRQYANQHLYILSGLYGVLRALDTIQPYRLEMGYKLPKIPSLYKFWGDTIATHLPLTDVVVNLSAAEYTKAVFPFIKESVIISPKFLTLSPKTGEPVFVTVHAKIARGAFARWMIQNRIETTDELEKFAELGYRYDSKLSTLHEPVFVAKEFKGLGLSVRLT